jgi:hypothetical protein
MLKVACLPPLEFFVSYDSPLLSVLLLLLPPVEL